MVQTRSASSSPVKKRNTATAPPPSQRNSTSTSTTVDKLKSTPGEPLRLVIAPKSISSNARFISLASPIDASRRRYLFCPTAGVFELTKVDVPKHDPRSILFAPDEAAEETRRPQVGAVSSGYINKTAEYMTATPYDLCFALLPIAAASGKSNLFQSLDDFLDSKEEIADLGYIVQKSRTLVEGAIEAICDFIEAGDEKMYRYSQEKVLKLLVTKAKRACENGLPASLEEKFVTRALETPMLSVKREASTVSISKTESQDSTESKGTPTPSESFDTQSSAASAAPSVIFSEASATSTLTTFSAVPHDTISEDVKSLQRLIVAFKFITASYVPSPLAPGFLSLLQSPTSPAGIDFTPLTAHVTHLTKLRSEAAASADLSSFTRKRGSLEDDEEAEARAEKKRKLEEEEKRKKMNISRGVKDLAKVDVKGMKKMSAFFQPKGKAKK